MGRLSVIPDLLSGLLYGQNQRDQVKSIRTSQIRTSEPFVSMFPINTDTLAKVETDMKSHGFDESQPVHVWEEQKVLIDGHTRLKAARSLGLSRIPAYFHSFGNQEEAIEYALHLQGGRRNLTDADILTCVARLDSRGSRGRPGRNGSDEPFMKGSTKNRIAGALNLSTTKVQRTLTVLDKASSDVIEGIRSGRKTINQAYNAIQDGKKAKIPTESQTPTEPMPISSVEVTTKDRVLSVALDGCSPKQILRFYSIRSKRYLSDREQEQLFNRIEKVVATFFTKKHGQKARIR